MKVVKFSKLEGKDILFIFQGEMHLDIEFVNKIVKVVTVDKDGFHVCRRHHATCGTPAEITKNGYSKWIVRLNISFYIFHGTSQFEVKFSKGYWFCHEVLLSGFI